MTAVTDDERTGGGVGVLDRPAAEVPTPRAVPRRSSAGARRTAATAEDRSVLGVVATLLTGFGILALSFVAFQLWGSDVVQARSQRELRSQLDSWLTQADGFAAGGGSFGSQFGQSTDALGEELTVPELDGELGDDAVVRLSEAGFEVVAVTVPSEDVLPGVVIDTSPAGGTPVEEGARITVSVARLGRGAPVALLRIPRIGVEQVVVEGTSPSLAMEGPGHVRGTAQPGEPGRSVVLGHRTTYGAPFARLGELMEGDEVQVLTTGGAFVYRVAGDARVLGTGEPDVIDLDAEGNRLVLATAHPELQASERLVVEAELEGDPVEPDPILTATADDSTPAVVELDRYELGRSGNSGAWTSVLLWGELLVAALILTRLLYRRWLRWPTWLLTTPVLVALCFLLFGAINRLLPSTL